MYKRNLSLYVPVLVAVCLFLDCAGQAPPGGGPVDAIPPVVIRTIPDTNAVRVKDNSIELEFSEYVDRRSVEESIFISPYVGELEFDWGTTSVRITPSQALRENTTYVVNVGTDVVDLRARNRMASGYTLAFSTGDSIDQGFISGRVFDEKPEGIMIFAYALSRYNPDTLDPSTVKPDYIMQTGKNGLFTLSNIALDDYRIIAVRDEYRNLLYEKQIDHYGVTVGDTALRAGMQRVSGLRFRLSSEDTARPFLTSAQPLTPRHIQVRFSEAVDTLSFESASFSIVDTLKLTPAAILLASLNRRTPSLVDIVTESPLDTSAEYRVNAQGILDRFGNSLDSARASVTFTGTALQDSTRTVPTLRGIEDSTKGIALEKAFHIEFSEPVMHPPLSDAISLRDSARVAVPCKLHWLNATDVQLIPSRPLRTREWYHVRVVMDSIRDYAGNAWKDSTWNIRFQALDVRGTGTIQGEVVDERKGANGPIYITAVSVNATPVREKTMRLSSPASFTMEQLPEGAYTFKAFRDTDTSGSYSFGRPFPFVPSERFIAGTDTINVRARWEVEGVVLKFK